MAHRDEFGSDDDDDDDDEGSDEGSVDDAADGTTVHRALASAIQIGAPAYNEGDHLGCYALYSAVCTEVAARVRHAKMRRALREAIAKSACEGGTEPGNTKAAWTMRGAMDALLSDGDADRAIVGVSEAATLWQSRTDLVAKATKLTTASRSWITHPSHPHPLCDITCLPHPHTMKKMSPGGPSAHQCDVCDEGFGTRYRCAVGYDFDVCASCMAKVAQPMGLHIEEVD